MVAVIGFGSGLFPSTTMAAGGTAEQHSAAINNDVV